MSTTREQIEETNLDLVEPGSEQAYRSLRQDVWRQFKRHKGALVGLVILTIIVVATIFGPFIYSQDPFELDITNANMGPSAEHLMGTDNLGRDVMARILIGGRISLSVGFAAMIFGVFLGTLVGVLAGFFRRLDGPLMRVTDLFLALPILPLL
ncbi:MAG: ABC transporter permease, partial [Acidimicrobiia bacterium]